MAKKVFKGWVCGSFNLSMPKTVEDLAKYFEENEVNIAENWPADNHLLRPPRRAWVTLEVED